MPVVVVVVPGWSLFGTVYVLATTVAVGAFGRHGATQDLAQRGVGRSGRESVMAVDRFCRNAVGPPEWECEAMGSMVWVQYATSAECIHSIDSRVLRHGQQFVVGHTIGSWSKWRINLK